MKKFLLPLCLLILNFGQAQSIITMIEKTSYGSDTIAKSGPQIVDINGNLSLYIDKELLAEKIAAEYPQYQASIDLQKKIDALDSALSLQEQIFADVKRTTLNTGDLNALYSGLNQFYQTLDAPANTALAAEVNDLFNDWRALYGRNGISSDKEVPKEVYILSRLNDELGKLKTDLENSPGKSYSISMVAYMSSKLGSDRVHIENFDNIKEKEVYIVQRWVTTLSDDQLKQLQNIKERAEKYNAEAPKVFEQLKQSLLQNFPDLACIETTKTAIVDFVNSNPLGNVEAALKDKANEVVAEYNAIVSLINNAKAQISSWNIDSVFEILDLVQSLQAKLKDIEETFTNFQSILDTLQQLKTKAAVLYKDASKCYSSVRDAVNAIGRMTGLLKNQSDRYKDNLDLGDEILKFTLNDLPSEGYIRLKGAGPREAGDNLEINLVLLVPKSNAPENAAVSDAYDPRRLETWDLQMEIIGLRSETSVGIIMAEPLNAEKLQGELPDDRRFLYAPSASLLLKIGSRKHRWYNDFVDLGLGIAISTPDFNTDGTPEFGVGGMLTVFKDILSVGYSYNVTLDVPYWHFGINLPFNLPGIPINTPK
ncbi:hypothetical protein [Gilvibacter sediminis]|uniref:hypothetical protein n=1 Tax=Gilvibacter sediminis TaxID=379071 RepID=UPI002350D82C|nr:hypothetical protein [Gilvibacter sediminis]MDC7998010.1 hypothetical protein [Gilvibacter sediminis]